MRIVQQDVENNPLPKERWIRIKNLRVVGTFRESSGPRHIHRDIHGKPVSYAKKSRSARRSGVTTHRQQKKVRVAGRIINELVARGWR